MLDTKTLTFGRLQHRKAMSLQFRRTYLGIKEDSHYSFLLVAGWLRGLFGYEYGLLWRKGQIIGVNLQYLMNLL